MSFRRVGSARPAWIAAMVLCVGFPGIALAQTPAAPLPPCPADPFVGQTELSAEQLVAEVLARNPSLQAMNAAWRAAAERCPQVISLDDPMFGFLVSTAHVGMNDPEDGWMVEASQRVPWMGKRALRGESASAEAQAAASEAGDTRLRLVEAGRIALYDYYQARRQLEVNRGITELMSGFREVARTRYEASQATEQDVLMADVELGDLQTRKAELGREETIAVARINTLLHREAGYPLPAPPQQLDEPVAPPQIELLHGVALTRPDLAARAARVRAEEAAVELAHKEFMPDLDFVARYDTSMADPKMRPVLGMNLNVPVQRSRRWAAVRETSPDWPRN